MVVLNWVYSAWVSNNNTDVVKDTTSQDCEGEATCLFLHCFVETSVNVWVCLKGFINHFDKG